MGHRCHARNRSEVEELQLLDTADPRAHFTVGEANEEIRGSVFVRETGLYVEVRVRLQRCRH